VCGSTPAAIERAPFIAFARYTPGVIDQIRRADYLTKVQYLLMVVFGAATGALAFAPLPQRVQILGAGVAFGITVGLWFSHLLSMVVDAATDLRSGAAQ
jgi:hypothetical protein